MADLQTSYPLVYWACSTRHTLVLPLISMLALALVVGSGYVSWSAYGELGSDSALDVDDAASRSRFVALLGVLLSGLFVLLTIANAIPRFAMDPCLR